MALSSGIPIGLLLLVVGAILFFATGKKQIAKVIMGIGGLIALLTVIVIVLAVNSM